MENQVDTSLKASSKTLDSTTKTNLQQFRENVEKFRIIKLQIINQRLGNVDDDLKKYNYDKLVYGLYEKTVSFLEQETKNIDATISKNSRHSAETTALIVSINDKIKLIRN